MTESGKARKSAMRTAQAATEALRVMTTPGKETKTEQLDRLIHERLRLALLSALAVNDSLTFNDLKALLGVTDGNLSVHARKLEEANYIACKKGYEGRVPKTEYRITDSGRRALERYLNHMESIIKAVRKR